MNCLNSVNDPSSVSRESGYFYILVKRFTNYFSLINSFDKAEIVYYLSNEVLAPLKNILYYELMHYLDSYKEDN